MLLAALSGCGNGGGTARLAVEAADAWTLCATENKTCVFSGTRQVKYGTATQYVTKTFTDGVACNNGVFGDPAPGSAKACWYASTTDSPTAPTPSAGNPSTAVLSCNAPGESTDTDGSGDAIEADLASADGTRMVAAGASIQLRFVTRASASDVVNWQIADAWGTVRASGSFAAAAGPRSTTLDCVS
ncbi:MAG TPA: hypothetical protein VFG49_13090, partial [Dyella sp.]|uniref:hypothetical protein n=1 Tax=Dyella sp. TaxID=1869338 RepID=UPI002D779274